MSPVTVAISEVVLDAAREYARRLRERFGERVIDVRLFGSYARGEAHEESDVDLFVVLDRFAWREKRDAIDLGWEVGFPLELRLSPTVFDRETFELFRRHERAIVMDVLREGVPL